MKRDVTSGQSVDYVTPVFNVENGWLIFTIGQSQLCSMLDLSVAHLNTCAILNADGEIVYQNTDADVDWAAVQRESVEDWREIDGSYVLTTSSGELGLSCVYAISKAAMLAEVREPYPAFYAAAYGYACRRVFACSNVFTYTLRAR